MNQQEKRIAAMKKAAMKWWAERKDDWTDGPSFYAGWNAAERSRAEDCPDSEAVERRRPDCNLWIELTPDPDIVLATFENPYPERDYLVHIVAPEFTCLCPKTGQPDFATLTIEYIPNQVCVELKSLKLYLHSFRNVGAFHEQVSNDVATYLEHMLEPRELKVTMAFWTRGGIDTTVTIQGGSRDNSRGEKSSEAVASTGT